MTESFRLGPDDIYRCDAFQEFLWQEHGFGTRSGNPAADITLKQIHSDRVVNAAGLQDRQQDGDALITDHVGVAIGVRTADCVPLLILDGSKRALAAVHAGWRGTSATIAKRAIQHLASSFASKPEDLFVAIGPCIRACCYQVGEDVALHFAEQFPEWGEENPGKRNLDLVEANRRQLTSAGVSPAQIFDCGLCTTCLNEQFFSFRREPEHPGRMMSAIKRLA